MPNLKSGRLSDDWGEEVSVGNDYKGAQSISEVGLVLGSTSMALVQGFEPVALGQDSSYGLEKYTYNFIFIYFSYYFQVS